VCRNWMGTWIGAFLFCLVGLDASAAGMTSLLNQDLKGCIGVTADGRRMACVGYTGGRSHLEVKDIQVRRMYRVFILGTDERPLDPNATPKDKLKKILKTLDRTGFSPIQQAEKDIVDVFRIPGLTCGLSLSESESRLQVQSSYGKADWLDKDGLRGKTTLAAVSVSYDHSHLFIVLDHQTPEGDTVIREFKVLRLQDLTSRGDCARVGEEEKEKGKGQKGKEKL
jgi:hypothetical protein